MECVMCGKTKQEWYLCKTCYDVMKEKYPKYEDLIRAVKFHKKNRREK